MTKNQPIPPASRAHYHAVASTEGKPHTDTFTVYADGSSLHNPGPAGWAVLIIHPGGTRMTLAGSETQATNNQMELRAAIEALYALPRNASGVLYCDSEYVVNGVTVWRKGWEMRGWRNSKGQPVANAVIWRTLHALCDELPGIRFQWVRGHAGNDGNELVDTLARAEAEKVRAGLPPVRSPRPFGVSSRLLMPVTP